jgi:hypothetical protein
VVFLSYVLTMKRWILALSLTLAAVAAQAQIYKWVLPDGSIEYSDRPPGEGAERVELSPLVTYTPPPVAAPAGTAGAEGVVEFDGYDSFTIASPANDAAVRDNAGDVTLNFAITPTLVEGHAIDIFMDGRKFGRSTAAVVTLSNVSRGRHQINATIVDESGAELARTGTVRINLLRVSDTLSDEEKPSEEETAFDERFEFETSGGPVSEDPENPERVSGGPVYIDPDSGSEASLRESGGAASQDPADPDPGRRRRSGGAKSVTGSKSPGGVIPQFGAKQTRPPPPPSTP